jgi:outer membrane lipoprotein-sorting protein
MKGAKFFFCATVAASVSSAAHAFWDQHAKEMLQKCMEKTLNVNVRAIVSQRCLDGNQVLQIKVEQSKSGKSRMTIIAPIGQQGVELVDDGDVMTTYDPDTRETEVRRSQRRRDKSGAVSQADLAERNYSLAVKGQTRVAGRPALIVTAAPKHRGLTARRYYIDAQTAYLLRLDVGDPSTGGTTTCFDTVSVMYPKAIEEPRARASRQDVIKAYTRTRMLSGDALNFCGEAPRQLPYGFNVQEVEALGDSGRAVRVTDGLVRGMVYQWKRKSGETDPDNNEENWADVGDYRVLISLDIPSEARHKVLEAFLANMSVGTAASLLTHSQTNGTTAGRRRVQE